MSNSRVSFLNLKSPYSDAATARYAVLPVPYEGTVSYLDGTAAGPMEILDASTHVELFDEELLGEFHEAGIATLDVVPPAATPLEQMARIRAAAEPVMRAGRFLLTLGGEHSISAPLVEAASAVHGPISVLQIDAHADLRDVYCGTKQSHGSVMRRVLETTGSLCQVGIRSFSKEEFEQCRSQVDRMITPAIIAADAGWIDRVLAMLREKVYITVDIDGFDPSFAPGTGTPEPGGLDWPQVCGLLRRVCKERQVVSADIVEVRPIPPDQTTEYLAARLAYKIIAYTQQ